MVSGVTRVATCASSAATEPVSQFGQPSALAVVETQAPPGEPGLQHSILFAQERDHVGLLTMEPAAQRRDQQLEREHARSLRHTHWIVQWDTLAVAWHVRFFRKDAFYRLGECAWRTVNPAYRSREERKMRAFWTRSFKPSGEMDRLLAEIHPNAERSGCPDLWFVWAMAKGRLPAGHRAYSHLTKCSPCYREYRGIQQTESFVWTWQFRLSRVARSICVRILRSLRRATTHTPTAQIQSSRRYNTEH